METILPLIIAGLAAAAATVIAVVALLRGGRAKSDSAALADQMVRLNEKISETQGDLAGRLAQMATTGATAQTALGKSLNDRLDIVSKRLGDSLVLSSDKTAKTMADLRERLGRIDAAQKNITELSGQVVSLQEVLSNKQARGAFGEIQLNDLVTNNLPPTAYQFQATLSNGKRCDCLLKLPNPPGPIAIDAKFPLESYQALRNAEDDAAKTIAGRAFKVAMQTHIDDIAAKYIIPGETAESALMFLPSEAVYAELHANFAGVVDRSYKAKVFIVSPTSLWAVLNTIRAVMKDVRMREQAGIIQTEVLVLLDDIGRLDKRVENLQRHFDMAQKDIREIGTSTAKISRRAAQIGEAQLEELDAEEALEPARTGEVYKLGGE